MVGVKPLNRSKKDTTLGAPLRNHVDPLIQVGQHILASIKRGSANPSIALRLSEIQSQLREILEEVGGDTEPLSRGKSEIPSYVTVGYGLPPVGEGDETDFWGCAAPSPEDMKYPQY